MKFKTTFLTISCFIAFAITLSAQVKNPGNALVAHYPLDGTPVDLSLNQLHGSILGNPQTVSGPVNTAYKFDGINDVIVVNHQECFNSIDTAFTVSGWVNPFSVANGNTWLAFICKGNELGLNSSPFSVLYNNDNNDLVPFIRYTDEQGNFVKYAYPTTYGVELNKWTFFTWTFDNGLTKVYKNGQLIGTTTISITHLLKTDQPFEMGRDYPRFPEKLDGILDDICLFNKALSDDQVLDMYQNKHCYTPVPETQLKTICEGESYLGFTQTGTYYDTVKQLNGCHALQEIHLKVWLISVNRCNGILL